MDKFVDIIGWTMTGVFLIIMGGCFLSIVIGIPVLVILGRLHPALLIAPIGIIGAMFAEKYLDV